MHTRGKDRESEMLSDLNENPKDFCARQEESVGRGEGQGGAIW